MNTWHSCNRILVIRADNMGDILMSSPAIRALKESFQSTISLLTSAASAPIASLLPEIDHVLIADLPWVKGPLTGPDAEQFQALLEELKKQAFDACVIFTVYSQNPLPAALLAYMAGIPHRLAYCRENPYDLLNNWVPEKEPYQEIKHQIKRDLALVAQVGAHTTAPKIQVKIHPETESALNQKLVGKGISLQRKWAVLHPGVSEEKRRFPKERWLPLSKALLTRFDCQLLFTGSASDVSLTEELQAASGPDSFSLAGMLELNELALLLKQAFFIVTVNTLTSHLASAFPTPLLVLYAQTNPQHHPQSPRCRVLEFGIPESKQSRNEVVRFVHQHYYHIPSPFPSTEEIVAALNDLLPS